MPTTIRDTSLCAIVRDELMNPAGGIAKFVNAAMPFLEEGVIVDTGSKDGTREMLEEISAKYKNLRIYDRKFRDYSDARNCALGHVKTKRVLVLDADERLTRSDFAQLKTFVEEHDYAGYNFGFLLVTPELEHDGKGHNPRLFDLSKDLRYQFVVSEYLYKGTDRMDEITGATIDTGIHIKHFCPKVEARWGKHNEWYRRLTNPSRIDFIKALLGRELSPCRLQSFKEWKEYNPRSELYQ